jgi:predicted RNase H-like nuclease (RuvC/YqgF family)
MLTSEACQTFNEVDRAGPEATKIREERNALNLRWQNALKSWRDEYDQADNYPGYNASRECRDANTKINKDYHDEVDDLNRREREVTAGTFADLYADPANHSRTLLDARVCADAIAERDDQRRLRDAQNAVDRVKRAITDNQQNVEYYQRQLRDDQDSVPNLEERLAQLQEELRPRQQRRERRAAAARVVQAQRNVDELRASLAEAERLAAEAAAKVEATDDSADA